MSLRTLLPALTAVALVSTGCLRTTTTVVVGDSGSGTADILVAVDAETVSQQGGGGLLPLPAGLVPDDPQAVCTSLAGAIDLVPLPAGATTTEFNDDQGFCGRQIHFEFADPHALTTSFDTLSGSRSPNDILRLIDDQWLFDAPLVEPIDLLAAQNTTVPAAVLDQVTRQQQLTYIVTLPGEAAGGTSSNADEIEGATFTWTITSGDSRDRLVAVSNVGGGGANDGLPLLPIGLGVGALVVVGGGAALVASRRGRGSSADGAAVAGASSSFPAQQPEFGAGGLPQSWSAPAANPTPAAASPQEPMVAEPRWDPARDAWVADHPVEGLLIHDDVSGEWRPA